ncbi:MAG: hypothetical protein WCK54_06715 [Desulfuromonadales bacterium]
MMSLFKGWPKDRIAQIYTQSILPENSICVESKNVKIKSVDMKSMVSFLYNSLVGSVKDHKNNSGIFSIIECTSKSTFTYRVQERFASIQRQISFLFPFFISDELLSWVEKFKPDAIYSTLYGIDIMCIVSFLSKSFDLPVIPHFMDDWPDTLSQRSLFLNLLDSALKHHLINILASSPLCMVISDAMASEYEVRYLKKMIPLMHCIEINELKLKVLAERNNYKIRFIYIGGLHLNRWKSLQQIGNAMSELAADGVNLECVIYTHPLDVEKYRNKLTIPNIMWIEGSLSHDEVLYVQVSADCLLHIESFDSWDKTFTRLSVSSKIPEYLAAGRPIFAYGPEELASIKYIKEIGCGFIVGQNNLVLLKQKLLEAATSSALRNTFGKLAFLAAEANHNATKQRLKFRDTIQLAINNANTAK